LNVLNAGSIHAVGGDATYMPTMLHISFYNVTTPLALN